MNTAELDLTQQGFTSKRERKEVKNTVARHFLVFGIQLKDT